MISDNYVTGDNIFLRELQNFFFEVLGMMSITHYGAVGDGRVDNYGPLQVAIDDAKRRGLSFLYVPYGRFIYTGELQHIDGIIFMGNPHAHIVNIRTGEEIKIYQFGWLGEWYYNKEESDGRFVKIAGDTMTGSLAIGSDCTASGTCSFAQGTGCEATANYSHAEGSGCVSSDDYAHTEGMDNTASKYAAHAEGFFNTASGEYSHAEGNFTLASGAGSHAEGKGEDSDNQTIASGAASHAEGNQTHATGEDAHAEGYKTIASGNSSHAEGDQTQASTWYAHAEGHKTTASGMASHAAGQSTTATRFTQTAMGFGNIAESGGHDTYDATTSALVIGNGTEDPDTHEITPSNAFKVQFDGTGWFSGDVYVGSTSGTNKDSGSKKLISEADLQAFATLNNLQMPS